MIALNSKFIVDKGFSIGSDHCRNLSVMLLLERRITKEFEVCFAEPCDLLSHMLYAFSKVLLWPFNVLVCGVCIIYQYHADRCCTTVAEIHIKLV